MTKQLLLSKGEHLGFCPMKGDLYSVESGLLIFGKPQYRIYSLKGESISELISFQVIR